jgi:hypothetical protein
VAQTFEVANSEFVTGTAAAERFIIHSGVSAFVSAGTGDTVDLAGAITDYTYKASGNQLQISDGVNTTILTVGGAFTLRTASGSTPVVLDFAAGGVIKLGTQVVGSVGFDAAAAITNVGNISDNAIPALIADTSSNELLITEVLAPMSLLMTPSALSEPMTSNTRLTPTKMPIADLDAPLPKMPVMFMPAVDDLDQLLAYGTAAGGEPIHEHINGFWKTSLRLADFSYPDSFDMYSLRTPISPPIDTGAAIL